MRGSAPPPDILPDMSEASDLDPAPAPQATAGGAATATVLPTVVSTAGYADVAAPAPPPAPTAASVAPAGPPPAAAPLLVTPPDATMPGYSLLHALRLVRALSPQQLRDFTSQPRISDPVAVVAGSVPAHALPPSVKHWVTRAEPCAACCASDRNAAGRACVVAVRTNVHGGAGVCSAPV